MDAHGQLAEAGTFLEDLDARESSSTQSPVAPFWLHPFFARFPFDRVGEARLARRRPLRASLWRRVPRQTQFVASSR